MHVYLVRFAGYVSKRGDVIMDGEGRLVEGGERAGWTALPAGCCIRWDWRRSASTTTFPPSTHSQARAGSSDILGRRSVWS